MIEQGALIVVIDDERDVREAMHAMLAGWGLRSVCQPDAHSEVQALENESSLPLLIISEDLPALQQSGIAVMHKPVDTRQLKALIQQLSRQRYQR